MKKGWLFLGIYFYVVAASLGQQQRNCDVLFEKGNYKKATQCYKKNESDEQLAKAETLFEYQEKGFLEFDKRNYLSAIGFFRKIVQANPKDKLTTRLIALIEAIAKTPSIQAPKTPSEKWLFIAEKLIYEGQYANAKNIIEREKQDNEQYTLRLSSIISVYELRRQLLLQANLSPCEGWIAVAQQLLKDGKCADALSIINTNKSFCDSPAMADLIKKATNCKGTNSPCKEWVNFANLLIDKRQCQDAKTIIDREKRNCGTQIFKEIEIRIAGCKTPVSPTPRPCESWLKLAKKMIVEGKCVEAEAVIKREKGQGCDEIIERLSNQIADCYNPPCNQKRYDQLKNAMRITYKNCRFKETLNHANELLAMKECLEKDPYTTERIKTIRKNIKTIREKLRQVDVLRSGIYENNGSREEVKVIYESLYKRTDCECVTEVYCNFCYDIAESIRNNPYNKPCNEEALKWYKLANRICPPLPNKDTERKDIGSKIKAIEVACKNDTTLSCEQKDKRFKKLIEEADSAYQNCRYEVALSKYDDSKQYQCSDQTTIINRWVNKVLPAIEKDLKTVNRFDILIETADSLVVSHKCQVALDLYRIAYAINTKCISLINKSDSTTKIEAAKFCCGSIKIEYGRLVKALNNAIDNPIPFDPRVPLHRDICNKAALAIKFAESNKDCISEQEVKSIEKRTCAMCRDIYPYFKNRKSCEPSTKTIDTKPLDSTKYTVWELVASGYGINAQLASPIRDFDNKLSLGGASVGMKFVHGTKLGEFKVGLMYAYDRFEVQSMTVSQNKANIDQIEFDFIRVPISIVIPLGGVKRRANQVYPFAELGVIPQFPIKYNHFQTLNQVTTNDSKLLYGLSLAYHLSLGLQIKRLSISAFYNSSGTVFASSATGPPLNLTNSAYTTLGFNLGYRFAFKHNM
jgi:hypothetical protein